MIYRKASKRAMLFFALAPIFCGALRIALYPTDFSYIFSSLFCSAFTLVWAVSLQKKIPDKRLRSIMMLIAVFLLVSFTMQILRHDLHDAHFAVQRQIRYFMYIPMTVLPILCFLLSLCIYRPGNKPLPRSYLILVAIGALLVSGILTNDMHQLAMTFSPDAALGIKRTWVGPLFYAINSFNYGLYVVDMLIIQKKNRPVVGRTNRYVAFVPFLVGLVYFFTYPINIGPGLFQIRFLQAEEVLCFCIIATLEIYIQMGMIPANKGYEHFFSSALVPAVILDSCGSVVYRTAVAEYPFAENEDTKIMQHGISGGSVVWTVDVKKVREINRQLEEAAQRIAARNAYIAEENRIKREKTELETRNGLYDSISHTVQPQLKRIDALLKSPEGCGKKQLAEIAVLKAYVKRRSNMELLAASGSLSALELVSAITESLEYMRLGGVNTAVSNVGFGQFDAKTIIFAYEHIERVVEECLDTLSFLAVSVRADEKRLTVRMMLKAEDFTYALSSPLKKSNDFSARVSITKNNQDIIIVFTFTEGGETNEIVSE